MGEGGFLLEEPLGVFAIVTNAKDLACRDVFVVSSYRRRGQSRDESGLRKPDALCPDPHLCLRR